MNWGALGGSWAASAQSPAWHRDPQHPWVGSAGSPGLQGVKEQPAGCIISPSFEGKHEEKNPAASLSVALRAQYLLQAVSISYKCLSYKKEVWLKHMQDNNVKNVETLPRWHEVILAGALLLGLQ